MLKRLALAIGLASMLTMALALTACNTVEGAGQDIQQGGEKLENAADRHKD